ncbi:hypothetical protein PoB_005685700 [Plakobranchus ocellatus]|uniref:Uncharacterized protein n=1 Tax=Plakobranchus ocellatus TaxID=259542 RepID=A0AAV4CG45_9GAST|nr:hypothetical protein PoB_005685700 [Plakobranchus ocellatus]
MAKDNSKKETNTAKQKHVYENQIKGNENRCMVGSFCGSECWTIKGNKETERKLEAVEKNDEDIMDEQNSNRYLTFDSLKPLNRIRAGYLTLDVRPHVQLVKRSYKGQHYGHGKDRYFVCVIICGKGGHVERLIPISSTVEGTTQSRVRPGTTSHPLFQG